MSHEQNTQYENLPDEIKSDFMISSIANAIGHSLILATNSKHYIGIIEQLYILIKKQDKMIQESIQRNL